MMFVGDFKGYFLNIKKVRTYLKILTLGCTSGNVANSENVIDRIVWRDIERFVEFYELNKDFIDSL